MMIVGWTFWLEPVLSSAAVMPVVALYELPVDSVPPVGRL